MDFIVSFLNTDVRMMMPILIAAMGLVFSERAGILNIGAEGILLIGAFMGYLGVVRTGSLWLGLLWAIGAGAIVGVIYAFMVVTLQADQTVVGTALNMLGLGISTTLLRITFGVGGDMPMVDAFKNIHIPVLTDIPVIGGIFFDYNILVYLYLAILLVNNFVMFKTKLGLKIRAVGENPRACDTLGINVYRIRYGTIIYSTMLCGAAGAYLSTAQTSIFVENMAAGRGFMALSAVVFGRYKPLGVLGACLVFGAGQSLQVKLAAMSTGIPDELLRTVPYVLTVLALVILGKKSACPAASTVPYDKD